MSFVFEWSNVINMAKFIQVRANGLLAKFNRISAYFSQPCGGCQTNKSFKLKIQVENDSKVE